MSSPEQLTGALREMFQSQPRDLGAALDDLGLDEVAATDPPRAIAVLFGEQGRALVSSPLLDRVVLAQLPASDARRGMLYPAGSMEVLLADPAELDEVIVPRAAAFAVVPASAVSARPVSGFGSGSGWFAVSGLDASTHPTVGTDEQVWQAAAIGRHALTAELIGVCESALAQVGEPDVAGHREALTGAALAVTQAREMLGAALDDRSGWSASLAKAQAGRTQAQVMRAVLAATDFAGVVNGSPVARHVARGACLDLLLGSYRELDERVGRTLVRGEVPFLPVVQM